MMQYTQATRKRVKALIWLSGLSGSGKTMSAMEIAAGLSGDLPFYLIDTEARKSEYYVDEYRVEMDELGPPFTPERYVEMVTAAAKRGFPAVIVDSLSDEHESEGGLIEIAEKDNDMWRKAKRRHKKMLYDMLHCGAHVICTVRSVSKTEMVDDPDRKGKKKLIDKGVEPVTEKGTMYKFDIRLDLDDANPGMIDYKRPKKIMDPFLPIFRDGQRINREIGDQLRLWSSGEPDDPPNVELWRDARAVANDGKEALRQFSVQLTDEQRRNLRPIGAELNATARKSDETEGQASLLEPQHSDD